MNGKIKFRCFDSVNYNMKYFDGLYEISEYYRPHKFQVEMQYAGFEDKDGKEIYEEDIVKYKEKIMVAGDTVISENIDVVRFNCGCFLPRPIKTDCGDQYYDIHIYDLKVIGNTCENPELFQDQRRKINDSH